jgi:tetratricopeptide (TPR) repeat protein
MNKIKNAIFISVGIIVITILLLKFVQDSKHHKSFAENLNDIKKETQHSFDSLANSWTTENGTYRTLDSLILKEKYSLALELIDSLSVKKPNYTLLRVYKGMVYHSQKLYTKAIQEYDSAMSEREYPVALDKRAKSFIELNQLDKAIDDYRKAYDVNYVYSLQLGTVFELNNNLDSAIYYYKQFQLHYPNSPVIKEKLDQVISKYNKAKLP